MSIPWRVSLVHYSQVEFKVGNVGFCEWRKTGEKSSEPTREPTTNSTLMWRHVRASNLGHSGGRQVRLPKRHPRYSYLKKIIFIGCKDLCNLSKRYELSSSRPLGKNFRSQKHWRWNKTPPLTLKKFLFWRQVEAYPCDGNFSEDLDDFVEDPKELVYFQFLYTFFIVSSFFFPFIFVFFVFFRILLMFLFYFCQCSFCGYCLL